MAVSHCSEGECLAIYSDVVDFMQNWFSNSESVMEGRINSCFMMMLIFWLEKEALWSEGLG